jgi:uncharacterized membrane protein YphA (DoxX/SURF4 family)
MIDNRTAPYAALVLRVSLGVMFITAQFFQSVGLPARTAAMEGLHLLT